MITDTEAIVLRQVKTMGQRRMILLFTKKFGKISAGTSITEGGKNKSALILRPFTYGRYELFKGRESYNLNSGQVLESFYKIGEDFDKYIAASYILELTDKLLIEEDNQPRLFQNLLDFQLALEKREKKIETLVIAYIVKAIDILGIMPNLEVEGLKREEPAAFFDIKESKFMARSVFDSNLDLTEDLMIYPVNFDIVSILKFFQKEPFSAFEKIGLDEKIEIDLKKMLKKYMEYHLDIGELKSEMLI